MIAPAASLESPAPTLAVIVVAHSSGRLLLECARRVLAAERVEALVVVDNASTDGSVAALAHELGAEPRLRILRNELNLGFAQACNQGAAASAAPWFAFLNPDCLIEANTFACMLDLARRLPAPGVLGADVRDGHGRPEAAARRRDPTPLRAFLRLSGIRRSAISAAAPTSDGSNQISFVDATSGALMLIPRAVFTQLGGFDGGYRLHAEDLDLCRRARESGLTVAVAEEVRVVHLQGSSSARAPLFVAYHKHRGMWRYFRKFDAPRTAWPLRALVWLAIWSRFVLLCPWWALRQGVAGARREVRP